MPTLSVVINAQNVEKDLPRSLSSVKNLVDEIVVVDQGSTDSTSKIAKEFGAKIYKHEPVKYVELARNFAISKAMGDWIFILDPDEEVGKELVSEIKKIIKEGKADYYRIPRKNIIFGKWIKHSRWWPDANIRLFKKGFVSWNEIIHAVPMTQGKGGEIESKEELAIIHHHYESIEEYVDRMNRYTTEYSKIKLSEGYKFIWSDLITKPISEFLSRYFYGQGYKDGLHGLSLSLLQAFSELVVYLKIWQKWKFEDPGVKVAQVTKLMREQEKNLHYWEHNTSYNETGGLIFRILRKLKI